SRPSGRRYAISVRQRSENASGNRPGRMHPSGPSAENRPDRPGAEVTASQASWHYLDWVLPGGDDRQRPAPRRHDRGGRMLGKIQSRPLGAREMVTYIGYIGESSDSAIAARRFTRARVAPDLAEGRSRGSASQGVRTHDGRGIAADTSP